MSEEPKHRSDPRWGQTGREEKADAIFRTVAHFSDRDISRGIWLDIGCGSGGVAAMLAQQVEQVIGVDPEPWERWERFRNESPNLRFHAGSYRDLTTMLPPESVDVVVCNQVYEHVDDPAALLEAIKQVMKPGGMCYFAGPNLLWPIEPHVFWPFVHWLPRGFAQRWMRRLGSRRSTDLDAWSWSYWGLTQLFRRSGYRYVGAIHARIRAGAEGEGAAKLLRMAAWVPCGFVTALTPIAPGFVFVLTKPSK